MLSRCAKVSSLSSEPSTENAVTRPGPPDVADAVSMTTAWTSRGRTGPRGAATPAIGRRAALTPRVPTAAITYDGCAPGAAATSAVERSELLRCRTAPPSSNPPPVTRPAATTGCTPPIEMSPVNVPLGPASRRRTLTGPRTLIVPEYQPLESRLKIPSLPIRVQVAPTTSRPPATATTDVRPTMAQRRPAGVRRNAVTEVSVVNGPASDGPTMTAPRRVTRATLPSEATLSDVGDTANGGRTSPAPAACPLSSGRTAVYLSRYQGSTAAAFAPGDATTMPPLVATPVGVVRTHDPAGPAVKVSKNLFAGSLKWPIGITATEVPSAVEIPPASVAPPLGPAVSSPTSSTMTPSAAHELPRRRLMKWPEPATRPAPWWTFQALRSIARQATQPTSQRAGHLDG